MDSPARSFVPVAPLADLERKDPSPLTPLSSEERGEIAPSVLVRFKAVITVDSFIR